MKNLIAALATASILLFSPLSAQNGKNTSSKTQGKADTSQKTTYRKKVHHGKYRLSIKP